MFAGVVVFLLTQSTALLSDPDTQWHIAVGQRIWRTGELPRTDEFSHTFSGQPWIAKEWLAQLLISGAYALGGWTGVVLLATVTIAGAFAALFHWLSDKLRLTVALAITLVVIPLAAGQFLARPHIFYFILVVVWVGGLHNAAERGAGPPFRLLILACLWANLHASFTIAAALAAMVSVEAVHRSPAESRTRVGLQWCGFLGAAVLAAFVTPYGPRAALISLNVLESNEAVAYITEWQPLRLSLSGIWAVCTLLSVLGLLLTSPRRNAARLVVVAGSSYLMLRHVRFAGLFGFVAAMSIARPLADRFPALQAHDLRRALSSASHVRRLGLFVAAFLTTGVLVVALPPTPNPSVTPRAALAAARAAGITGPVYNDYGFGGFLIAEGVPTFIDGRTDQLFLNGFIRRLQTGLEKPSGEEFLELLARFGVTWALVAPDSPARRHLANAGWRELYADASAVVMVGPQI